MRALAWLVTVVLLGVPATVLAWVVLDALAAFLLGGAR